ncbi:hypothetical protein CCR84_02325 [Rhodocyclus purpureus]|nr:glycosyltransferase [Rhodocyclus purpureus]MBK5913170.1 hypothetical protein [Rhodocyclus purpureus]
MCVVAATPLTIYFFLQPHLVELSREFDVTLVCNPSNDAYLPPLELPVRQIAIGMKRKISPLRDLHTLLELSRLFRREHFDIVVSVAPKAGLLGMLAAAFAGVEYRVHIFQGEVWASRTGLMRVFLKAMDRITATSATHIMAVGRSERRFLEEQGVVKVGRVEVLGSGSISGVDLERFRPNPLVQREFRSERGIPDDAILCLFLGRLTADKGVFDLARAFSLSGAANPKLWLILAGPDEEGVGEQLRQGVAGEVSKRMLIDGFTHAPERYLAAADFLCLPSYREGFAMVIIEAAAVGIPSIGTLIYGIADTIVDNETGVLVSAGDVSALAEAITKMSTDASLRERMARAGRVRVEVEFSQGKVVAGYVDFFRRLLSS